MFRQFLDILSDTDSLSEDEILNISELYNGNTEAFVNALGDSGLVDEDVFISALSAVYGIPVREKLVPGAIPRDFMDRVSIGFLKSHALVPLEIHRSIVTLAIHDPGDLCSVDDIVNIMDVEGYELVLAHKKEIIRAINHLYNETDENARELMENMEENGSSIIQEIKKTADLLDDTSEAPVIRLVNYMISQSVKANASDIHIEPYRDTIKIRYRIDGILYDLLEPPKWIQAALVSRVKVMADMDIAEKRVPQDGRIEVRIGEQNIDIRVSTVPTSFGERLVMRLLNKSGTLLELSQCGISAANLQQFERLIRLNNGIILVTGPTGSGKTTTLYAALSAINSPDKNIITIEDPVEYNLMGIGQIQVNRKVGMTFAKGLRSIVRQDPDVILVGEIRDLETAEIAIQSALTGHLVFSTLHTNDSAGAVTRLVDLGVEPYLITSSVKAVVAQRLVRVLCRNCRVPYVPDAAEMSAFGFSRDDVNKNRLQQGNIYRAKGCSHCFNTGYAGRKAVFEIMEVDEDLKNVILETSDANNIKKAALKQGMTTLRRNGIERVLQGMTSAEEVFRVT